MKKKSNVYICLLLYVFLCSGAFAQQLPRTEQSFKIRPASMLKNVYFNPVTSELCAYGNGVDLSRSLGSTFRKRPFVTLSTSVDLKAKGITPDTVVSYPGTVALLFECCSEYFSHFYHLLEHLMILYSLYGPNEMMSLRTLVLNTPPGKRSSERALAGPNAINTHLTNAVLPHARVQTWEKFIRECKALTRSSGKPWILLGKALVVDRVKKFVPKGNPAVRIGLRPILMVHALFENRNKWKRYHEALDVFSQRVRKYTRTESAFSSKLRVMYIERTSRRLVPSVENALLRQLKMLPFVSLHVIDFAKLPFRKQIAVAANADVMIGVHGNGLSHALWMPKGSTLIELIPGNLFWFNHYRIFAALRGIQYHTVLEDGGLVDNAEYPSLYERFLQGNIKATIDRYLMADIKNIDIKGIVYQVTKAFYQRKQVGKQRQRTTSEKGSSVVETDKEDAGENVVDDGEQAIDEHVNEVSEKVHEEADDEVYGAGEKEIIAYK